ncbi:MAG: hypothetical protein ACKVYV_05510 [Limisphaerales bacterium]
MNPPLRPCLAGLLAGCLLLHAARAQNPPPEPPDAPDLPDRELALEEIRREAGDAMREAQVAVEHAVRLGRDFAGNFRFEAGGQPRILVVPARGLEPRRAAELREDLAVMHRILAGALPGGDGEPHRVEWFMGGGWAGPQALYLPGSGPVFFLEARVPLVGPPDKPATGKAPSDTDRVWEEARRELRGGPRREVWMLGGPGRPPYDELRVGELRRRLTAALKHARNIRGLGPSEKVTLVVTGPAAAVEGGSDDAAPPAPGTTVMTLIATGDDLAALARGDAPKLEAAFQ